MPDPLGPVVALDIDGTLGAYHTHFRRFAEMWTGRTIEPDWNPEFKGSFNKVLHMSKPQYRQCKLAYRQGGMKRSMPAFPCIRELTVSLRKQGAQVWICTTRPYLRLDNIDPDTRHWLRRNKLQFDGVLYGDQKYRDLVKIVGKNRIVAVMDDLPEMIVSAHRMGLSTVMRLGAHNAWWTPFADTEPVTTSDMALGAITNLLDKWKANQ